jgi:putative ABC transport system permease protein
MHRREYLSELRQDLTFAARQLLKHPGFSFIAIFTLALGIGGTAAIFSVVNAVVLRPLPLRDPDRLVSVRQTFRQWEITSSNGNLAAWRDRAKTIESIAGGAGANFNFADDAGVERVIGQRVTADFFRVFGVPAMLGRTIDATDDRPGHEQVVVLSQQVWARRFGADRSIIGREIRMNRRPYRVIGVMPASFRLTDDAEELWVPLALTPDDWANFGGHRLDVVARLKPGVALAQARAELAVIAAQLRKEHPAENGEHGAAVVGFVTDFVGAYRQRLFILLGAVGLVLLIACANVANLLLAHGGVRLPELAMRAALGAGRGRIVRQLLTESLLLAALGAAAGLALATVTVWLLPRLAPHGVPRLEQARLDPLTLAVTALVAISSSVIFGLLPSLRAARAEAADVLKGGRSSGGVAGGDGARREYLRHALVMAEVALALMLLAGSGLLIRTALVLQKVDLGFDPVGVLSARISMPVDGYEDSLKVGRTFERIVEETRRMPGVAAADVVSRGPLSGGGNWVGLYAEGRARTLENAINAQIRVITPEYFQTMRMPIRRGRAFTADDRAGMPNVIILSESVARQLWPGPEGDNPIGKRVDCFSGPEGPPSWKTVVGIVADLHARGPAAAIDPEYYLPIQQAPERAWVVNQRTMTLVARPASAAAGDADADAEMLAQPMRQALARVDPTLPLFDVQTMTRRLRGTIATNEFNTMLLATLGGVGLLLAVIGIYGVIAYFVSQRTQEIGVRLALGASPRDVLTLVVKQALRPVLTGVAVGIALALVATRLLENQLFGITSHDPLTFIGVTLLLVTIALAAALIPARRAARVDPTRALNAS